MCLTTFGCWLFCYESSHNIYYMKRILLFLGLLSVSLSMAQAPIKVGSGSYAEYTPLYMCKTDEHEGDKSRETELRKLYITDRNEGKPIPSNDWWTNLITNQYSGRMWSYPQVVQAESYGFYVGYPKTWIDNGTEMKWKTSLQVRAKNFNPESAMANNWSDWGLDFVMQQDVKRMKVTMAHGVPFTFVEPTNLTLQIRAVGTNTRFLDAYGDDITFPFEGSALTVLVDGDAYGVYLPQGTVTTFKAETLQFEMSSERKKYLSIAVLPSAEQLTAFAPYACVVPRSTSLSWKYNEKAGQITSTWKVLGEDLSGGNASDVLQGFIPHHYKDASLDFTFNGFEYASPRGKLKLAAGNTFNVTYNFNGILPYFAAPVTDSKLANPFIRERMIQMIAEYAKGGGFGADTYWGGKGLTQMALYMTFAYELGEMELFEACKSRLKENLVNWYTYTPGERNFFFARYNRWGSLVGYATSYDSDTFNDHHFHYGYFTLASGILSLFDKDFRDNYGQMATLVAKDYANWDKNDNSFPFFRTLDPWAGHSYAGGMGDGDGNGQESTSEAMQGWTGLYMMGVATGNKAMRDAGIFGWETESRATAEYWFDRDRENINYNNYKNPYCSNLTSKGIGWWTWFSGDPVWMHSIQWMPMSPGLKYLYKDLNFAKWDFETMWKGKQIGGYEIEIVDDGAYLSLESGLGNVCLTYKQIYDPDNVAAVFDQMWDGNMPVARNVDTGGITYYVTHSHRTYGDICWNIHADIPTATTYIRNGKYTYVVYNADAYEKTVSFYDGQKLMISFKAPAGKLTVYQDAPVLAEVVIDLPSDLVVQPGKTLQLNARLLDQYGATMSGKPTWTTTSGSVNANGLFVASAAKSTATITASFNGISSQPVVLTINNPAVVQTAEIEPAISYAELGNPVRFTLNAKDQYGNIYNGNVSWKITRESVLVSDDSVLSCDEVGVFNVEAEIDGKKYSRGVCVMPSFPNIAIGKTVKVSSEENAGTLSKFLNDGDLTTRWSSAHKDNEWAQIDLKQTCYVGYLTLVWETAYASSFEILLSDNGSDWTSFDTFVGTGGTQRVNIDREARFVRMVGLTRATTYGTSLYEFEIHGIEPNTNLTPKLFGLAVEPKYATLKERETLQLEVKGYDQFGKLMDITPTFKVTEGSASVSASGLLTANKYGKVTVSATANGKSASVSYLVEEAVRLDSITITPDNSILIVGESQSFEINAFDQFGAPFPSDDIELSTTAGGRIENNVFFADAVGDYTVSAGLGGVQASADVRVTTLDKLNLAYNKPTEASSIEGDAQAAFNINDGKTDTRWSSKFTDNEWIMVDLLNVYKLTSVELDWETSSAVNYQILLSENGEDWIVAADKKNMTPGARNDKNSINSIAARYVKVYCTKRSNMYGFSVFEIRVYGTDKLSVDEDDEVLDEIPDDNYPSSIASVAYQTAVWACGNCIYVSAPQPASVAIYDILGRLITQTSVPSKDVMIPVGKHGIYIVKVCNDSGSRVTKLLL